MRTMLRTLAPSALLLTLLLAPAGAATAAPSEGDSSFSFTVDDCDGDSVHVDGTLHVDYELQRDWTILVTVDGQGEAVGSQGTEYVFQESHQERVTFSDDSFDYRARLISQGSAPDEVLLLHYELGSGLSYDLECN